MKNQKGITLVALIVTIIVMLILVAVSVTILVNSNLIGHAEKAGAAYNNATDDVKTLGSDKIIDGDKSVEDYMKNAKVPTT